MHTHVHTTYVQHEPTSTATKTYTPTQHEPTQHRCQKSEANAIESTTTILKLQGEVDRLNETLKEKTIKEARLTQALNATLGQVQGGRGYWLILC